MCRQSGGSIQHPVPQEMDTQPGVPLDPCGNGHAQPHSPQGSSLALSAPNAASALGCLLQGMGVMQWCPGVQVLPPGSSEQLCKEPPKKNLGKVWLWRNAWPFSSPPPNLLLPGVWAHPGQPGGKPQSKKWRINTFSALCQSIKRWETRPCAPC